ncbi:helix-turn-helix transcriptional regulator [Streptomyces sp. NPDC006798]|uniref:helix-turn-helix domain-containing protein n=1 Tax=unclassified Streptomyces TaxID=2593676 RepID=UPI003317F92C
MDTPRIQRVGQQLAARRTALDLTQQLAADRIGVTPTSVSSAERGLNQIQRSRRADWERVLRLTPGTISRAYTTGSDLEPAGDVADPGPPAYADLSDPHERAIWEMGIPEVQRREIIDMLRLGRNARNSA